MVSDAKREPMLAPGGTLTDLRVRRERKPALEVHAGNHAELPRGTIERHDAAALEHDEPARIVRRRRHRGQNFKVDAADTRRSGLTRWFNKIGEGYKGTNSAVSPAGPRRFTNVTSTPSRFSASVSREGAGDVSCTAAADA
ncbi:hypothetical protein ABWH74_006076 [Burkholderia vietnamiensis]|jgi:hypothetical protein|uniref:hypothetical protein n=1 Tax=Burkholderia cepacia complex TaxID=87882 RepID=UPI0004F66E8F|nr:hypothetical protein DM80_6167 [Burkholderia multivorans]MBH9646607.1 hypothetical protein [Burkholderia vietnamiensis]MBR7914192.1 hypothetical protein [Burkholderia vietnamiensis]MBR8003489.1 hypothetical protein [Burkholderia vietnamiensis]MBR8010032.1 hypothetical protein [Burkholderia vietnamiensis]